MSFQSRRPRRPGPPPDGPLRPDGRLVNGAPDPAAGRPARTTAILTGLYGLLVVYGTLFPLAGWRWPESGLLWMTQDPWARYASRSDMLLNLLIYAPLGLLLMRLTRDRGRPLRRLAAVTLSCATLSLILETAQAFLPSRSSSLLDVVLNTVSGLGGALLGGYLGDRRVVSGRIGRWRREWFQPGVVADLGMVVVGGWALAQLSPLVPSPDIGNLRQGLSPLYRTLTDPARFSLEQMAAYWASVAALALVFLLVSRPVPLRWPLLLGLVGGVLACKVPVITRQLSLEALSGAALGLGTAFLVQRAAARLAAPLAALFVLLAVTAEQLRPGSGFGPRSINWVPFVGQMGDVWGLADILGTMWPYLALSYLAVRARPRAPLVVAAGGGLLVLAYAFGLEWVQQQVPGRYPDVTDAVLAAAAWALPWLHPELRREPAVPTA